MNQIRIVPINHERTDATALYHCDACDGFFPDNWPRWRIEAGYNHGSHTRTMRLCNFHRDELAEVLFHHIFAESHGKHEKSLGGD